MCGIAGIFSLHGRPLPDVLPAMNAALVHRGPDEAGFFVGEHAGLAMRRLSIIGVSNGRQPIFNEDRTVAVILNGEIYNYLDLKSGLLERGHRFTTDSDAETIVHLYEEHGAAFVDHLRGMFALALYDLRRNELYVVRDRPGKKPVYYAEHDGLLLFASEIKALHASGLIPKELDPTSLPSYLSYGFVVGERTLFQHVRKLPAGCLLKVSSRGVETHRYWDLPAPSDERVSIEDAAARLRELLAEAVRKRLMSEVPLGAFLSGGVDSSAVVALMAPHLDRIQTFCVGFADARYDELAPARAVAERFGTQHHELVLRGCTPALLREINHYNDEPAGDSAAVPTFCLSRFARQHITVALTGEGGDETFAGYPHHRYCRRLGQLESAIPGLEPLARLLGKLDPIVGRAAPVKLWKGIWIAGLPADERVRGWLASFLDPELRRLLRPDHRALANGTLSAPFRDVIHQAGDRDPLAQLLYVDSKTSLADQLLMKVDKMGMAASLEARCPLLDQDLIEYAAKLPTDLKLTNEGSKIVLRSALQDLIPADILNRPKHGFDVPLDTWLQQDLRPLVEEALLAPQAPLGRYLDLDNVRTLWTTYQTRPETRPGRQIWRLLNLAVWHEVHWPSGMVSALEQTGMSGDAVRGLVGERRTGTEPKVLV